jgi:DNA-binding NarL/FixJ family response regulator
VPVRVLIVDDDAGFVEYLRETLSDSPGIEVVGSAADGVQALQAIEEHSPDVVTMDLDMPKLDGVEATRLVLERHPGTVVILVSGSENHAAWLGNAKTETGARDFVTKGMVADEIEEAILCAASQSRRLRLVHI